jgi:hypothetical protein
MFLIQIGLFSNLYGQKTLRGKYHLEKCGKATSSFIDFRENSMFEFWINSPNWSGYDFSIGYGFYNLSDSELSLNFVDYNPNTKVIIDKVDTILYDTTRINLLFLDNLIKDTIDGDYYLLMADSGTIISRGSTNNTISILNNLLPVDILVKMIPFRETKFRIDEPGCYFVRIETALDAIIQLESKDSSVLKIKRHTNNKLVLYNPKWKMKLKYHKD